jgi:hypothetical protein
MPDFFARMQLNDISYLRVHGYTWVSCTETLLADEDALTAKQGEFSVHEPHELVVDILRRARDAWQDAKARFDDAHEIYTADPEPEEECRAKTEAEWTACLSALTEEMHAARDHFAALIYWATRDANTESPDAKFREMCKDALDKGWAEVKGWKSAAIELDGPHYVVTWTDEEQPEPQLTEVELFESAQHFGAKIA